MAGKFSLITTLTLQAAGFNKGIGQAKATTKDFAKGVETAKNSVKSSFSNISGLAGGLGDGLNNSLGGLPIMLTGAVSGFRAMIPAINSTKTALIASGIGAIVIALGLAFAALTSYLSGTSEGAYKVKEMFGYISGAATALMNRLKSLGSALFSILTGDIEGFKTAIADAFKGGFIDEVIDGAKTGNALAAEQNRLKKEKNLIDSEELDVLYKQAELTKKAKDVTAESNYTAKQRLAFEQEAIKIGDDFDSKKMKHLKDVWNLETALNKQKTQLNQQDIEKELAAKKAYFDYVIKDQQDAIGENKIIAKTQKEIDGDAIAAAKERIALEKQYRVEKIKGVGFTQDSLKPKGKGDFKKQDVIPLEFKKLDNYSDSLYRAATHQQALLDAGKTGWQQIKEGITNTTYLTESAGDAIGGLTDAFTGLFDGAEGGFKNVVTSMLGGIQQITNALLAQAIGAMIAGEAHKGLLGLATAAIGVAAITGLWKSKVPAFAGGGIVGGNSITGDRITARVNSGEMILNTAQQANLFAMANTGGGNTGGVVKIAFVNGSLEGYMDYRNKRLNNFR